MAAEKPGNSRLCSWFAVGEASQMPALARLLDLPLGVAQFIEEFQKQLGLTYETAHDVARGHTDDVDALDHPDEPVALLAQTTLGLFEWEGILADAGERYPSLRTARKSDLCYATTNRQTAILRLAEEASVVLVVGSKNSSNTQALVRVANMAGVRAHRVDGPDDVNPSWFADDDVVFITAARMHEQKRPLDLVALATVAAAAPYHTPAIDGQIQVDGAGSRDVEPEEEPGQGGLAGPVRADNAQNFAFVQIETDLI